MLSGRAAAQEPMPGQESIAEPINTGIPTQPVASGPASAPTAWNEGDGRESGRGF